METTDLYLEHDKVFIVESDTLVEADYDRVEVGTIYFIITKTKRFSIYKKSENFDDDFLKLENDRSKAEEYLKRTLSK